MMSHKQKLVGPFHFIYYIYYILYLMDKVDIPMNIRDRIGRTFKYSIPILSIRIFTGRKNIDDEGVHQRIYNML